MLCTGGAGGTCSCCRMSGGGTFVTPYGRQSAAHAAGTSSIAVVTRTDAHGPDGDADGVAVTRGVPAVGVTRPVPPHPAFIRAKPVSAVTPSLRIASPRDMLAWRKGHPADKVTSSPRRGRMTRCPSPLQPRRRKAMNRDELRAAQAPLKQRYREEPSAAMV